MIYAAIHQFGGTIKGNPKLRFQWATGRWATVSQVTIPARPFFPVANGHLTPKAEEKIKAAGERALARQAGGKRPIQAKSRIYVRLDHGQSWNRG